MRALPYVLIAFGTLLLMAGFAQMPIGTPPTALVYVLLIVGTLLLTAGCYAYWYRYERRPLAPAWDGPPRTIVPPVRPRR